MPFSITWPSQVTKFTGSSGAQTIINAPSTSGEKTCRAGSIVVFNTGSSDNTIMFRQVVGSSRGEFWEVNVTPTNPYVSDWHLNLNSSLRSVEVLPGSSAPLTVIAAFINKQAT